MKYLFKITFLAISFFINVAAFAQTTELSAYASHFNNELKGWTKAFTFFNLSTFKKAGISNFEDIDVLDINDIKQFYSIYKPALSFSFDKNQFIDIYSYWLNLEREGKNIVSYGGEADQAITMCNFKTKKWTRIFFRGTNERIQDVSWVTNTEFILVGFQNDTLERPLPIIYIGNTITKTFTCFICNNKKSIIKSTGYDSPKLLKLKIKEK
jgi:hypothetical protein